MIETLLTKTPPLNETISLSTCFEPQICTSTMSCMLHHIFVMTVKPWAKSPLEVYTNQLQNKTKQNNQNQSQNNKKKVLQKTRRPVTNV
jgi:hypothetical protein